MEPPIKSMKRKENVRVHGKLFSNNNRCLVCGPSGCGKTVVLFNLITRKNGLEFTNLYIISQTLEQEKYRTLRYIRFSGHGGTHVVHFHYGTQLPNDVEVGSIVVFDEVLPNEFNIANFFAMGRHRKLNCFFLCQTYTKIPKQLVRDNANFIILFRKDDANLKHVYNDHVGSDFTFQEFKDLCNKCRDEDEYGFMVIDKQSAVNKGKYRCKFDKFYTDH